MKRKIIGEHIGSRKVSSGFIEEYQNSGYYQPELITLDADTAYKLYRHNEIVNGVVNHIMLDVVKQKPKIVMVDQSKEMQPKHKAIIEKVQKTLMKPNPNKEPFMNIRKKFVKDLLVAGVGAQELVREKRSRMLEEVYALKASNVTVSSDKHGNLKDKKTYKLKSPNSGDVVYYDKDEVLYATFRPVSGMLYGEKPLDALANTVASDILRAAYNTNFFVNGAESSGVLSLKDMNKRELEKFRQHWSKNHKGSGNAHKMIAVNVPIEWIRMAVTNRDMEFSEYGKELKEKIYSVYGMQPIVMGSVTSTTGKLNSQEQIELYKDNAIRPILELEAYHYTLEYLWEGYDAEDLKFAFEGIDLADIVTQAEIDRSDINSGILTINEVRSRRGLNPVPWGDTPVTTMPGGGQIDPETGKLVSPSDKEDSNKPNKNDEEDEEDEKYIKYVDHISACVKYSDNNSKNIKDLLKVLKRCANIAVYVSKDLDEDVVCDSFKFLIERLKQNEDTIDITLDKFKDKLKQLTG